MAHERPTRHVNVQPYSEEYKPLHNIPIADCATVWTDEEEGQRYLLVFHECLFFGDRMNNSLICPNQMRENGLTVHDTPRQYDSTSTHSIRVDDLSIPLSMNGVVSGFHSDKPTDEEVEELPRIYMTPNAPWRPYSDTFAEAELKCRQAARVTIHQGDPASVAAATHDRTISAIRCYEAVTRDDLLEEDNDELYHRLVDSVKVAADDIHGLGISGHNDPDVYIKATEQRKIAVTTSNARSVLTPEFLSRRWNIGLDKAEKTLKVTTQKGVRNVLVPSERKVRKKAPWLKLNCTTD